MVSYVWLLVVRLYSDSSTLESHNWLHKACTWGWWLYIITTFTSQTSIFSCCVFDPPFCTLFSNTIYKTYAWISSLSTIVPKGWINCLWCNSHTLLIQLKECVFYACHQERTERFPQCVTFRIQPCVRLSFPACPNEKHWTRLTSWEAVARSPFADFALLFGRTPSAWRPEPRWLKPSPHPWCPSPRRASWHRACPSPPYPQRTTQVRQTFTCKNDLGVEEKRQPLVIVVPFL